MRILVTGATGFIGREVVRRFAQAGHHVVGLSRNPDRAAQAVPELDRVYQWNLGEPADQELLTEALSETQAVVHLAGENVAGRWTAAKRERIRRSRVEGTRRLVDAMAASKTKPDVLVSMSAIGYYGDRGERELTEETGPGDDFLAEVCREWEAEALRAAESGVRVVCLRTGIVLGRGGGAFRPLLIPARLGLGGRLGTGRQWWSWVHLSDLIRLSEHAMTQDVSGPVNATAPHPIRQREFAKALGRRLRRPAIMPAPSSAIKLVLGGFSSELLGSKRVIPRRALESGFKFQFGTLDAALRDILAR